MQAPTCRRRGLIPPLVTILSYIESWHRHSLPVGANPISHKIFPTTCLLSGPPRGRGCRTPCDPRPHFIGLMEFTNRCNPSPILGLESRLISFEMWPSFICFHSLLFLTVSILGVLLILQVIIPITVLANCSSYASSTPSQPQLISHHAWLIISRVVVDPMIHTKEASCMRSPRHVTRTGCTRREACVELQEWLIPSADPAG